MACPGRKVRLSHDLEKSVTYSAKMWVRQRPAFHTDRSQKMHRGVLNVIAIPSGGYCILGHATFWAGAARSQTVRF